MGLPNEVNSALIGAANQGGYTIDQSLRFNGGGPTRLTYDNTSGTNNSSSAWTLSFWMKRGSDIFDSNNGNDLHLMMWTPSGTCANTEYFLVADPNHGTTSIQNCMSFNGGGFSGNAINKLRDPSAWYHFVWRGNTGSSTNIIYINGEPVTAYNQGPNSMTAALVNGATRWSIGDSYTGCSSSPWDGHLAEVHFVDGQTLDHEDFGELDDNGVWRPIKYTGTYGTNGYYLKFDPSATNGVGHDHSGNGHHWTATNVTTSGTGTDISDDTPTNNFATFNPLAHDTGLGEGNTAIVTGHGNYDIIWTKTIGANGTGNYYWEYTLTSVQASSDFYFGVVEYTKPIHRLPDWTYGIREKLLAYNTASGNEQWRVRDTLVYGNAPAAPSGGWTVAVNDVIGVRLDFDSDLITISKNGTVQTGLSGYLSSDSTVYYTPATNFYGNNDAGYFNAGQRAFSHQPTGTSALSTATLAEVDIVDPTEHFQVVLDTGANILSSAQSASTGFSSGLWWIKDRDNSNQNQIFDTVSTSSSVLKSPANGRASYSAPSGNSVAWCWAAPSSSVSNTNGSITTNVYANDTAGFSIATWTGTGTNATVGHGLSSAPEIVWCTSSSTSSAQMMIGSNYLPSWGNFLEINSDSSYSTSQTRWNNTAPTSTVVSVANACNYSGQTMYMYSWRTVPGYSSIGSYIGNGDSTQGTFVYTGFRVRWLMVKAIDSGQPWLIYDTERDTYNPSIRFIKASATQAESADTDSSHDHLSNGFIFYTSTPGLNGSTNTYLYMAFAEHPFGGSNVTPSPAR